MFSMTLRLPELSLSHTPPQTLYLGHKRQGLRTHCFSQADQLCALLTFDSCPICCWHPQLVGLGGEWSVNGVSWRPSALECLKVSINFLHWNPTPVLEFIMYVTKTAFLPRRVGFFTPLKNKGECKELLNKVLVSRAAL